MKLTFASGARHRLLVPYLDSLYDELLPPPRIEDTLLKNEATKAFRIKMGTLSADGRTSLDPKTGLPLEDPWEEERGEFIG